VARLFELSDVELLDLLKSGDENAYAQIYDRYWAILYRYARRLLQDDQAAQDVVQDIFVMLWSKATNLETGTNLSAFLYASVRWAFRRYVTPYSVAKLTTYLLAKKCSLCFSSIDKDNYLPISI